MEYQSRPLQYQKLTFQWNIEDFNIHCAVADAYFGSDNQEGSEFEAIMIQDPYLVRDSVEVRNHWVIFLKKPRDGTFFSVGIRRDVDEFHEGIQSEVPFGLKASINLECEERQDRDIFHIDSNIFILKHGDSKEWEVPELNTYTHAHEERCVAIYVKLEIIPNILGQQDVNIAEEARSKLEVLEVSNDIGNLIPTFTDSDSDEVMEDVPVPFSDYTIKVNDGESDGTVKVHRCILAARSPVFKRMLENPMFNETQERTTTITDISFDAVQHFIRFLYSGDFHLSNDDWEVQEESGRIIMQLVYAADKYEVPSLKALCDQELHNFFTAENAYKMFDLCIRHDLTVATRKIEDYMEENIVQILAEKKREIFQGRARNSSTVSACGSTGTRTSEAHHIGI